MPYVNVHIEAADVLSDIDTDDLVEELETRNTNGRGLPEDARPLAYRLWEAFYLKKPDARVLELARELASTATGRMIP